MSKEISMEEMLQVLKREKIVPKNITWETIDFYKPKSSKEGPDGYQDRVGIREVLEISETVKEMIIKRASSDQIEKQAKKEGMLTMLEDGFVKAVQGLTSLEEILRVTSE